MPVLGGTYKVSFRGHADKDEVISNSNFFSLGPLFGSGMYGPPTGFSYIETPWVSHCFIEAIVSNYVPHCFPWWGKHTISLLAPHPNLNFYLTVSIPVNPMSAFAKSTILISSRDRQCWERVLEARSYRILSILNTYRKTLSSQALTNLCFKNWLHWTIDHLQTFIFAPYLHTFY